MGMLQARPPPALLPRAYTPVGSVAFCHLQQGVPAKGGGVVNPSEFQVAGRRQRGAGGRWATPGSSASATRGPASATGGGAAALARWTTMRQRARSSKRLSTATLCCGVARLQPLPDSPTLLSTPSSSQLPGEEGPPSPAAPAAVPSGGAGLGGGRVRLGGGGSGGRIEEGRTAGRKGPASTAARVV